METKLTTEQQKFLTDQQLNGIDVAKVSLTLAMIARAKELFAGHDIPKDKNTEKYIATNAKQRVSIFLSEYNKALRDIASEAVAKGK